MPTDTLLLYILPDLAYVARLIPGKKAHDFVLSDFRQINGTFLNDTLLLADNLDKLLAKLDSGSYKLILPDFLFTSTIVNVEKETEDEVRDYLKNELLPSLQLNQEDFYLDTTILSNYKGVFKVQLTALEKALLTPLVAALKSKKDVRIESVSPLSWSSKSIISLEPSVAILQLGAHLYLAEHYIGVDQCYYTPIAEASNFSETVKTLKGAEPSLQTVYLLTNSLIDGQLKEELKATLPVQQLADLASENEKMPSYVKQIIESAAKTFSIPEYLLPQFALDSAYEKTVSMSTEDLDEDVTSDEEPSKKSEKVETAKEPEETEEESPDSVEEEEAKISDVDDDGEALVNNIVKPAVLGAAATALPKPQEISAFALNQAQTPVKVEEELEESSQATESELTESRVTVATSVDEKSGKTEVSVSKSERQVSNTENSSETESEKETKTDKPKNPEEIDLSKFANLAIDPSVIGKNSSDKSGKEETSMPTEKKEVIKNNSEAGGVAKMIFIGLLSFVLTVALGVGLGMAYLHYTENAGSASPSPTPTVVAEAVTPTPTPKVELTKADYKLLVVNATAKAGYAGTIAKKIEAADFPTVAAANAKGDYEAKDYLLVETEDASAAALLAELNTATGLDLQLSTQKSQEDSSGKYDAVVVLGK